MQEETELIRWKAMAGRPVGVQEGFVILDEAFHASAGAVDFLVKKLGRSIADVRNDKTRVGLSLRDLRLVDDDARTTPATGPIVETGKEPHRLFGLLGQGSRLLHQRCAECFELLVIRLSQNEIYVVCVAQVVHLRGAEVRVTTQSDLHLRPGHEYMIQNALENRRGLAATDSATGSQNGRDQLARPPFVEMDWHVAGLVMVGVEQRELLCTVRGIVRVIDVQDELLGRLVVGLDEWFQ